MRINVHDRLEFLPAIFDLKLFSLTTGLGENSAKVMLSRWAKRGYVQGAGPKTGIYFKKRHQQMSDDELALAAALHFYPESILCGASVLHRNGWTTQIPQSLHLAIEKRPSVVKIDDVQFFMRDHDWFVHMHKQGAFEPLPKLPAISIAEQPYPYAKLRILKPQWALWDMRQSKDGWLPDDDDLDLPPEFDRCL